jgi:hypothetical protein
MNINLIVTLIFVVLILLLCLSFVFYKKIISLTKVLVNIAFPFLVVIALSTMLLPQLYSSIVEISLKNSSIETTLTSVDNTLSQVGKLQSQISNSLNSILNRNQIDITEYKSNLYLEFVVAISNITRIFILLTSVVLMFILTYVKYTFAGSFNAIDLQNRINKLELEVSKLKSIKS